MFLVSCASATLGMQCRPAVGQPASLTATMQRGCRECVHIVTIQGVHLIQVSIDLPQFYKPLQPVHCPFLPGLGWAEAALTCSAKASSYTATIRAVITLGQLLLQKPLTCRMMYRML